MKYTIETQLGSRKSDKNCLYYNGRKVGEALLWPMDENIYESRRLSENRSPLIWIFYGMRL